MNYEEKTPAATGVKSNPNVRFICSPSAPTKQGDWRLVEAGCALVAAIQSGSAADAKAMVALWRQRLDGGERLQAALAALHAAEPDDVLTVFRGAGVPVAPLYDFAQEAGDWAAAATVSELRAYAAATVMRLPEADRQQLMRSVS